MNQIIVKDLTVNYRVGVPDAERANPQKLLISLQMDYDFSEAVKTDSVDRTVDYSMVTQRLLRLGERRSWKLIETLAHEIAETLTREYRLTSIEVEVKKFIIPEARYVAVRLSYPG
jgi:7,8-dihydroneopterin aldolase/epimerase/oxygenase